MPICSADLTRIYDEVTKKCFEREEALWNALPYEAQLDLFCAVVRRIHQAELVDKGSYRHTLYQVFKFDVDAYVRGMDCGYLALHNAIEVKDEKV